MNLRSHFLTAAATMGCFALALLFSAFRPAPDPDCFVVKSRGYNTNCPGNYYVTLRNTCDEKMDIKIAVQRQDGRWSGSVQWGVDHNETATGSVCNSAGRYKYWVRPAGSSVRFPRDEEITD